MKHRKIFLFWQQSLSTPPDTPHYSMGVKNMPYILAHALMGMVAQAFVGKLFGFNHISIGIFFSAIVSMLVDIDYTEFSNTKRTPYGHSVLFAILYFFIASIIFWYLSFLNLIPYREYAELTISFGTGYLSHLTADAFTKGGIYTMPKKFSKNIFSTFFPSGNGDKKLFENWHLLYLKVEIKGKKCAEITDMDGKFNLAISIIALVIIVILIAIE